jgi:GDP-D-mannose 3', 5'-epimerase
VIEISGKDLAIFHVDGPVGVQNRGFRTDRIEALGWTSKVSLKEGLTQTYHWVEDQLRIKS